MGGGEKGRTRARDETSGGGEGLVFDERLLVGHVWRPFLLLLKLFGFSSDNLLKFMQKKFNGIIIIIIIIQNVGAEVDDDDDGSPPTHAVRAREGTRVTLCRVFVRLNAVFIQQQRLLLSRYRND